MPASPPPPTAGDDVPALPHDPAVYRRVQSSAEFARLRSTFRRFAFPLTVVFLVWYLLYVLLATYAVEFMSTPVIGNLNVGILLGIGQFVTTFVITAVYIRFANRRIDPLATQLRDEVESHGAASSGPGETLR